MDPQEARQIEGWLRRLPKRDALRPLAGQLLAGVPLPLDACEQLLARLQAPQRHRWQAVALSAALAAAVDTGDLGGQMLAALRGLSVRRTHCGTVRAVAYAAAAVAAAWVCCVAFSALTRGWLWHEAPDVIGDIGWPGGLALCGLPLVLVSGVFHDYDAAASLRAAAIVALGRRGDAGSLFTVASACCQVDARPHQAGERALELLLPALTVEQYGHVDPRAGPLLCDLLLRHAGMRPAPWSRDRRTALCVLDVLARVGDGRAAEPVRRVAESCVDSQIGARAVAILPVLQARAARERQSARLLRAAEAPLAGALLRAAAPSDADPARLLRPTDSG